MVSVILDNLAAGVPIDEIQSSYSGVSEAAIHAAISYAADLAREREVPLTGRPAA